MLGAVNLNTVLFMCPMSDLSSVRHMHTDVIRGHTDNTKTDEKQGCYSLQLLTDLAYGRRELKAQSCTSFVGRDVKRDSAWENTGLQMDSNE